MHTPATPSRDRNNPPSYNFWDSEIGPCKGALLEGLVILVATAAITTAIIALGALAGKDLHNFKVFSLTSLSLCLITGIMIFALYARRPPVPNPAPNQDPQAPAQTLSPPTPPPIATSDEPTTPIQEPQSPIQILSPPTPPSVAPSDVPPLGVEEFLQVVEEFVETHSSIMTTPPRDESTPAKSPIDVEEFLQVVEAIEAFMETHSPIMTTPPRGRSTPAKSPATATREEPPLEFLQVIEEFRVSKRLEFNPAKPQSGEPFWKCNPSIHRDITEFCRAVLSSPYSQRILDAKKEREQGVRANLHEMFFAQEPQGSDCELGESDPDGASHASFEGSESGATDDSTTAR